MFIMTPHDGSPCTPMPRKVMNTSVETADGNLIEFSTLTPEQKQHVREKIAENVGRVLGDYLSAHPEEIEPLSRCRGVRVITDS